MGTVQKLLSIALALGVLAGAWLWWNRPVRVDMAEYVPADSLVYVEANSLTEIVSAVTATDSWRKLAPAAGIKSDYGNIGWLSRIAALTGIGSAETVVFARTQVAVTVLGFDASASDVGDDGSALRIVPRAALVAETHTGATRTRAAIEKLVGDLARRAYGSPLVQRSESDEELRITWISPVDARRKIVVGMIESVAVIGNDETVVEACLAVRRGERPGLAGDREIGNMRARVGADGALAFGYIPPGNAGRLLEVAALPYVKQLPSSVQSVAAGILPQLANRILGGAAWSTRAAPDAIEDTYFVSLQNGTAQRLRAPLAVASDVAPHAAAFVPADTHQFTRYNYREPAAAWRGLNAVISSQLDALTAPFTVLLLEAALKPYGIETPREFLVAVGSELCTARLDNEGDSTVAVVTVRDRDALRAQVRKHLGSGARLTREGDAEMLISTDEERGAAAFIADRLILGRTENVRRCLEARAAARTLANSDDFKQATLSASTASPAATVTYTDDVEYARAFVLYFAGRRVVRSDTAEQRAFETALAQQPYAVSETHLVEDGFEKKTRSSFGQFGTLVERFASSSDSNATGAAN